MSSSSNSTYMNVFSPLIVSSGEQILYHLLVPYMMCNEDYLKFFALTAASMKQFIHSIRHPVVPQQCWVVHGSREVPLFHPNGVFYTTSLEQIFFSMVHRWYLPFWALEGMPCNCSDFRQAQKKHLNRSILDCCWKKTTIMKKTCKNMLCVHPLHCVFTKPSEAFRIQVDTHMKTRLNIPDGLSTVYRGFYKQLVSMDRPLFLDNPLPLSGTRLTIAQNAYANSFYEFMQTQNVTVPKEDRNAVLQRLLLSTTPPITTQENKVGAEQTGPTHARLFFSTEERSLSVLPSPARDDATSTHSKYAFDSQATSGLLVPELMPPSLNRVSRLAPDLPFYTPNGVEKIVHTLPSQPSSGPLKNNPWSIVDPELLAGTDWCNIPRQLRTDRRRKQSHAKYRNKPEVKLRVKEQHAKQRKIRNRRTAFADASNASDCCSELWPVALVKEDTDTSNSRNDGDQKKIESGMSLVQEDQEEEGQWEDDETSGEKFWLRASGLRKKVLHAFAKVKSAFVCPRYNRSLTDEELCRLCSDHLNPDGSLKKRRRLNALLSSDTEDSPDPVVSSPTLHTSTVSTSSDSVSSSPAKNKTEDNQGKKKRKQSDVLDLQSCRPEPLLAIRGSFHIYYRHRRFRLPSSIKQFNSPYLWQVALWRMLSLLSGLDDTTLALLCRVNPDYISQFQTFAASQAMPTAAHDYLATLAEQLNPKLPWES